MRLGTLRRLGRPDRIVRTHLDEVMARLSPVERETCARFFDRIVTPSQSKIACTVDDLAEWTRDLAAYVPGIVSRLSRERILRSVPPLPSRPHSLRFEIFHDVLGPAVLDWRERFVRELERRRRQRRRGSIGVLAAAAFAVVFGYAYSLWIEGRPWAVLTNLSTGTVHEVRGSQFTLGRNTSHYQNQIDIRPRSISRMHVMLFRDARRMVDMRSMFGTSVNGRFLPYGDSRVLRSGDILDLGGTALFRFDEIRYSWIPFYTPPIRPEEPAEGWGMLVDGRDRSITALYETRFSIGLRDGRLVVLEAGKPSGRVGVGWDEESGLFVRDRDDDLELLASWKRSDHGYVRAFRLEPGQKVHGFEAYDGRIAIPYARFELGEVPFQILLNLGAERLEPRGSRREP